MKPREWIILLLLFTGTIALRIFLSYQTPYFGIDESYATIRNIQAIQETLTPLFHDALSFSGRERVFSPLFSYFLAGLHSLFSIEIIGKVILNILAASVTLIAFLITKKLTNDSYVSLLTAFIAGFVPVYFSHTFNRITIHSITIPLFALLIFCFVNLDKKRYIYTYLVTLIVFSLLSPTVIVFILGLVFYLILLKVGKMDISNAEYELVFFSIFFVLWSQLILYKKILLAHGPLVIWQNLPTQILSNYFVGVSILDAVYRIGELPFIFGLIIIFRYIFKDKNKEVHFLIACACSTGLLLWLRLLPLTTGLIFCGMVFVLLFGVYYKVYLKYLANTRFTKLIPVLKFSFIIVFLLTSIYPSVSLAQQELQAAPSPEDMEVLQWLNQEADGDFAVFSSLEQGELVAAIAKRKNFIDRDFLGIPDANQRYEDYEKLLTTPSKTQAISLLDKYKIKYLWISPSLKKTIDKPPYIDDSCFQEAYNKNQHQVYKLTCHIQDA